jgi:long-subunit acyl-CoA synthetase (AMP-forming)
MDAGIGFSVVGDLRCCILMLSQAIFGFQTTQYKDQGCIWKNSYGSSEFPGISLNGAVSESIDLELVPIHDDEGKCVCNPLDPMNRTGRGEIRVRHKDHTLRVQYYRNPEATAAAFRDGWYYTGDVGEWAVDANNQFVLTKNERGDWNRVLVIVDRVKNLCELYVDGDSKWVDPSRLELEFYSAAPCAKQVCLVCDRNQPQMVALLVPSDMQRLRSGGDITLADKDLECNAELATNLLQQLISFAQVQAASSGRQLLPFELPCAVVVCTQPWTAENGFLTANGKLKRGDLKLRFLDRIMAAYCSASISSQTPSQVGMSSSHSSDVILHFPCTAAAVIVPSPVFGRDRVTKVEKGRFYMDNKIAFCVNDTVTFTGGSLPDGILSGRTYVVASKSHCVYPFYFEIRESVPSGRLLDVTISDTKTPFSVHHAVLLPAPLSSCVQQLGQLTGIGFIESKLPAEAIHRGRIKNDTSVLPFLEGSVTQRDFIAFEFKGADDATTAQIHELLSRLKELVQTYRKHAESWVEEINKIRLVADMSEIEQLKAINDEVDAKFLKFMWGNDDATAGTGFADDNHSFVDDLENLLVCLTSRIDKIKAVRESTKAIKSRELPTKDEFLRKYNIEMDTLRVLAPRFGLSIPYEIEHVVWWQASSRGQGKSDVQLTQGIQNSQNSTQNFGDIVISCCVTGAVIQENQNGAGKPRYNNMDDSTKQCSVEGYTLAQSVLSCVGNLRITHFELAEKMWAMLQRCSLFRPFMPENSASRAWCLEYNSSYHLLQSCFLSGPTITIPAEGSCTIAAMKAMIQDKKGFPISEQSLFFAGKLLADERSLADCDILHDSNMVLRLPNRTQYFVLLEHLQDVRHFDTPAGRLYRAFRAFANRPALGIPDAKVMQAHDLLSSIHFRRSAFADALHMELAPNRGYRWISFGDLGRMASIVAKVLRGTGISRGSFVAIAGYNDIEWAACDFACALAGLVSVGIHSTFNAEEALFALQNSGCVALLTSSDFVLDNEHRGLDKQFWSVQSVFALAKKKQQLATCKMSQIFLTDAHSNISTNHFAEIDAAVQVHSMVDMLGAPFMFQDVSIEHPDLQPQGGLDSLFTILHTGGSSGLPKQVMVRARGFARDIGAKNFMMPLVTCSYIPLSHSSDRFKLWEFCCCGGSVAFAFFEASSWLDHERLKKSKALNVGALDSTDFNNVDTLLRQLQDVEVSAMSCPPNILTGVYRMYMQWLGSGLTELQACERVRRLFGNRLTNIATGGAPTPSDVMSAVRRWFPKASFVDSFGTTESGAISSNGRLLIEKGVKVKVRLHDNRRCSNVVSGELLVSSPSMSTGYLNDETRTSESFIRLSRENAMIFPAVSKQDEIVKWYATGDLVEVMFDEFAFRNQTLDEAWAQHIAVKGRISAQVKFSSGLTVSPDVLEPIYASSPLFSDIYIDSRTSSTAIVAIVTPAASLKDIKHPDGTPMFDFDAICSKDFFTLVQGFRNEVGSSFYTRRRQVHLLCSIALTAILYTSALHSVLASYINPTTCGPCVF